MHRLVSCYLAKIDTWCGGWSLGICGKIVRMDDHHIKYSYLLCRKSFSVLVIFGLFAVYHCDLGSTKKHTGAIDSRDMFSHSRALCADAGQYHYGEWIIHNDTRTPDEVLYRNNGNGRGPGLDIPTMASRRIERERGNRDDNKRDDI